LECFGELKEIGSEKVRSGMAVSEGECGGWPHGCLTALRSLKAFDGCGVVGSLAVAYACRS
jgi:hypothetical protein